MRRVPDRQELWRQRDGTLEQHAWPGGYLIEWITEDGSSICANCATKEDREGTREVAPFMHEAGSQGFTCEECEEEKR